MTFTWKANGSSALCSCQLVQKALLFWIKENYVKLLKFFFLSLSFPICENHFQTKHTMAAMYELEDSSIMKNQRLVRKNFLFKKTKISFFCFLKN
jgi:hypothetical protein